MIRPITKVLLVLAAACAVAVLALAVEWAYYAMGAAWFWASFWTAITLAVVLAVFVVLCLRWTGDGKHGKGTHRAGETVPPWAGMERPAGIAHEPLPPEMLSAPVAAPCDLPAWAVQDEDAAPELTHDEYAPNQRFHGDGHASAPDLILTPYLAVAYAAAATLKGLTERAIVAEARAVPFKRWESDTYVGGIPVVLDEDGLAAGVQ